MFGESGVEGWELSEVAWLLAVKLLSFVAVQNCGEVRQALSVVVLRGELAGQVRRGLGPEPFREPEPEDVEQQVVDSRTVSESV